MLCTDQVLYIILHPKSSSYTGLVYVHSVDTQQLVLVTIQEDLSQFVKWCKPWSPQGRLWIYCTGTPSQASEKQLGFAKQWHGEIPTAATPIEYVNHRV